MSKRLVRKLFVSGPHNSRYPHLIRPAVSLLLAAVGIFTFGFAVLHHSLLVNTDMFGAIYPRALVALTNSDRADANVAELTVSPVLEKVAQMKADDMAAKGYFAHTSPEGNSPWHWFREAGYSYQYAGENLAVNFRDSADVENAWMNSPTHHANLVDNRFTEVGIATAEGVYQGKNVVFVAQEFGVPKKAVAPAASETGLAKETSAKDVAPDKLAVDEVSSSTETTVLGATDPDTSDTAASAQQASAFDMVMSNPGRVVALVYILIGALVSLALLILLFTELSHHHIRGALV